MTMFDSYRLRRNILTGALAACMLIAAGCATVQFQTGDDFDPLQLDKTLNVGVATKSDVRASLGIPYGEGRALMPYQETTRTVWTYYFEHGSIDTGGGGMTDQRQYLFVFFDGDRLDSYFWFNSKLGQ